VKFIAQVLSGVSGKDLPALIDEMKARLGSGAVLLIADTGGKARGGGRGDRRPDRPLVGRDICQGGGRGAGRQGRRRPARHGAGGGADIAPTPRRRSRRPKP
jgi:alanyl-tRNA synthetase